MKFRLQKLPFFVTSQFSFPFKLIGIFTFSPEALLARMLWNPSWDFHRWGILIRPIYFTVLKHQGDITQIFIWTWWSTQISQNSTDALGEKTLIYHFCSSQKHFLAMFKYTRAMRSNDFVLWGCNCASPQIEKRTLDFHTPWENYWRIENRWPFLGIRHKPAVDINPSYGQVKRLSCISLSRWKTCLSARNKLCEMKELMLLLCMKNNTT